MSDNQNGGDELHRYSFSDLVKLTVGATSIYVTGQKSKDGRYLEQCAAELNRRYAAARQAAIDEALAVPEIANDEEHPAYCASHKPTVGWCTCRRGQTNALRKAIRTSLQALRDKEQ